MSFQNAVQFFIFQILESFLQHLPKPVCLVAHHGLGFDFPLLRSELFKSESNIDPEILVVDSLEAFKYIFAEQDAADAAELVRLRFAI